MGNPVPDQGQPSSPLRTAEEWFAAADCTHLITMNTSSQNLHLERTTEGFQFTAGAPGANGQHYSRLFPSLDSLYDDWEQVPRRPSLRGPIWRDITAAPPFPYDVLWRPLDGPIDLHVMPDNEHMTAHGPHMVYGPADITMSTPPNYRVTALGGWLVVEHPATTLRGRGGRAILRPTHNVLDRLRLYLENRRLRRDTTLWTRVRPSVTVVYGEPPPDWQSERHVLSAEPTPPLTPT